MVHKQQLREDARERFSKLPLCIDLVAKKGKSSPSKTSKMKEVFSYNLDEKQK